MANTIQVRRGANASLPTLNAGEFGFSTDTHQIYVGDGAANHELAHLADVLEDVVDDTTPTLGGDLDGSSKDIYNCETVTFDAEYNNGSSGAADTINWNNGQKQLTTLSDNCTYTFTAPTAGIGNFLLRIVHSGASRNPTWPATVKWAGGAEPTWSTSDADIDIVSFYWNGTNYYGMAGIGFA
jgi:hypothetical protein